MDRTNQPVVPGQMELQQRMAGMGQWRNLQNVLREVRSALEGDSNDDEHDALASVAEFFGIPTTER